jgi:hypothetical protein
VRLTGHVSSLSGWLTTWGTRRQRNEMTENVDGYEVEYDRTHLYITFTDIFGEGEKYTFLLADAVTLRNAFIKVVEELECE